MAGQSGLCLTWSGLPKTGFLITRLTLLAECIECNEDADCTEMRPKCSTDGCCSKTFFLAFFLSFFYIFLSFFLSFFLCFFLSSFLFFSFFFFPSFFLSSLLLSPFICMVVLKNQPRRCHFGRGVSHRKPQHYF